MKNLFFIYLLAVLLLGSQNIFAQDVDVKLQRDSTSLSITYSDIFIKGRAFGVELYDVNDDGIFNVRREDSFILRDHRTHQKVVKFLQDDYIINIYGNYYKLLNVATNGQSLKLKEVEPTKHPLLSFVDSLRPFSLESYLVDSTYSIDSKVVDSFDFVYLNFWSYSCAPCLAHLPDFKFFRSKNILPIHILTFYSKPDLDQLKHGKEVVEKNSVFGIHGWKLASFASKYNAIGFPSGVLFSKSGELIASFSGRSPHAVLNFLTFYYSEKSK